MQPILVVVRIGRLQELRFHDAASLTTELYATQLQIKLGVIPVY